MTDAIIDGYASWEGDTLLQIFFLLENLSGLFGQQFITEFADLSDRCTHYAFVQDLL